MAEKVTIMVLKVDLQCEKCYKKVRKLLCKYPQIRDQVYDEKANKVIITVVCCSPEKIRDKLCCKGRGTIKSIDIKEPEKKKQPEKKKEPEKKTEPEPEKTKPKPAADTKLVEKPPADKPNDKPPKKVVFVDPPKADPPKPKAPEPAPKAPEPAPVAAYPPNYLPYGACCGSCYGGRPGGPCYGGHGMPMPMPMPMPAPTCNCGCGGYGMPMPMPAPPCNCGCGGRSICYDGYGRGYTVNRCDYFSEENPATCTVM